MMLKLFHFLEKKKWLYEVFVSKIHLFMFCGYLMNLAEYAAFNCLNIVDG